MTVGENILVEKQSIAIMWNFFQKRKKKKEEKRYCNSSVIICPMTEWNPKWILMF